MLASASRDVPSVDGSGTTVERVAYRSLDRRLLGAPSSGYRLEWMAWTLGGEPEPGCALAHCASARGGSRVQWPHEVVEEVVGDRVAHVGAGDGGEAEVDAAEDPRLVDLLGRRRRSW